jgi:hypothetical protein
LLSEGRLARGGPEILWGELDEMGLYAAGDINRKRHAPRELVEDTRDFQRYSCSHNNIVHVGKRGSVERSKGRMLNFSEAVDTNEASRGSVVIIYVSAEEDPPPSSANRHFVSSTGLNRRRESLNSFTSSLI